MINKKYILFGLLFQFQTYFPAIKKFNTLNEAKQILTDNIHWFENRLSTFLNLEPDDILPENVIDYIINKIKDYFTLSEQDALNVLKKLCINMDENNDSIDYNFEDFNESKIKEYLQRSFYIKLLKEKKIINSTCYKKIEEMIENKTFKEEIFYHEILPSVIEEREKIHAEIVVKANKFLAETRLNFLFNKNTNSINLIYKNFLISLMTVSNAIPDTEIISFLSSTDENKLLPLTEKDGSNLERIFYGGEKNKNVLIQFSFYPKNGFLQKKFKPNDLDFNFTLFNINGKRFYCLVSTEDIENKIILTLLFANEKERDSIQNYIIFGSKDYWEAELIPEIKSNNYLQNEDSITYIPTKLKNNKIIFPSFFLITDDKELPSSLPLLEKKKDKYNYTPILIDPKALFESPLSLKLDNNIILDLFKKENNSLNVSIKNKTIELNKKIECTKEIFNIV